MTPLIKISIVFIIGLLITTLGIFLFIKAKTDECSQAYIGILLSCIGIIQSVISYIIGVLFFCHF